MLKASAMYIVIIIALVIGVLCSSLIVAAFFYRMEYQKKFRYDQLDNNLNSGVNILLAGSDTSYLSSRTMSLFNNGTDSVSLKRTFWGMYDIGTSVAFIQKDTLYKTFSIAYSIDSSKWAALYLIDEERPLSLSGKTAIVGDVYVPKAGVTTAYVDNKAYLGDKRLIAGKKNNSDKTLPPLAEGRLAEFEQFINTNHSGDSSFNRIDTLKQSFLLPTKYFNFKNKVQTLSNINLSGNVILFSDTTINIDSTASLNSIIIYAKGIHIKSGFHGSAQFFARDSISVDSNCLFSYPSCLGVLRFDKPGTVPVQEKIHLGNHTIFRGILFTYEKTETSLKPLIDLGRGVKIAGQVYSQGIMRTKDAVEVAGSVFTSQFLYQNSFTLFQNYLINITMNSKALSPYYLTGDLTPVAGKKKKVLQWLEPK
ncbi:hypothetical protein [Mucilaginibacter gotjawali]|uniref:Uncharacterized protein n=1 Tax=Mucilaginibacter gotjawali TaxID=1550579 RepID=A0A839SMS1_9SPHI|nr:hypothetical protein [Mucilaginibacter gotjawali]MBB3058140.1 hypothetical protein [Mucilaginibacter gotjawali]